MYYKAAALAKHLQHNYKEVPKQHPKLEHQQANNDWSVVQFLFRLLTSAKLDTFLLPKGLKDFHSQYELTNKVSIDLDKMLSKQWIRVVAGDILIPETIKNATWKLENDKTPHEFTQKYQQELLFLSELEKNVCSINT